MKPFLLLSVLFLCSFVGADEKSFVGVWTTTYGRMRLIETTKNNITGIYSFGGDSTIEGKVMAKKLTFQYKEKNANGEGWFELSADGAKFSGEWKEKGTSEWKKWTGDRLTPLRGRAWLYVIEARWENSLEEREFAFADMIKTFFDRVQTVDVRRRSFNDSPSLQRWLKEAAYLPEPVHIIIASHGETNGLKVEENLIPASAVAEALQFAGSLKSLHFSSCLVMKNNFGKDIYKKLNDGGVKVAVSGYSNSFDWAASALFEMTYFDMILERAMSPKDASKTALKMFPLASSAELSGVPISPGNFKILF